MVSVTVRLSERKMSTLEKVVEDKSSHWNALLIFANTNKPSGSCSCRRLLIDSWGMTLEMKEELLFTIFVFGFLLFKPSLLVVGLNRELSSPNTGTFGSSLPVSWEVRDSFSFSFILYVPRFDFVVLNGLRLLKWDNILRGATMESEIFTPVVGGKGVVARAFGLAVGISDGCGGGVARRKSSRRT